MANADLDKNELIYKSLNAPLLSEPWFEPLIDPRMSARWTQDDLVARNQVSRHLQKKQFYRNAFDFLSDAKVLGDYFEFGVHRVRTFRMALEEAQWQRLSSMRFYAFDSFCGLPQVNDSGNEKWLPSSLSTSEEEFWRIIDQCDFDSSRIESIRGFYEKSLTSKLQADFAERKVRIAFCCIDCDLYESAQPVFDFIDPLLQPGSVFYIDDYFNGHKGDPTKGIPKAFSEFRSRSKWRFNDHLTVGWWGKSWIVY